MYDAAEAVGSPEPFYNNALVVPLAVVEAAWAPGGFHSPGMAGLAPADAEVDEPADGDAADEAVGWFAGANEERLARCAVELQSAGGADDERHPSIGTRHLLGRCGHVPERNADEEDERSLHGVILEVGDTEARDHRTPRAQDERRKRDAVDE